MRNMELAWIIPCIAPFPSLLASRTILENAVVPISIAHENPVTNEGYVGGSTEHAPWRRWKSNIDLQQMFSVWREFVNHRAPCIHGPNVPVAIDPDAVWD